MKTPSILFSLATLTLLAATSTVSAEAVSSPSPVVLDLKALDGEVSAVHDGEFDVMVGNVRHIVRTDASTKYRLGGRDSTRAKVLAKGHQVSVDLERGLATAIDAERTKTGGAAAESTR